MWVECFISAIFDFYCYITQYKIKWHFSNDSFILTGKIGNSTPIKFPVCFARYCHLRGIQ